MVESMRTSSRYSPPSSAASRGRRHDITSASSSSSSSSSFPSSASMSTVSTSSSRGLRYRCLVGLQNLGNTCFMNSSLQCLFSIPGVLDFFASKLRFDINPRAKRTKGRLVEAFAALAKQIKNGPDHGVGRPSALKVAVSRLSQQFSGYGQHDSQEFLRFLLDGIHDELNTVHNPPAYYEIKDSPSDSMEAKSRRWWNYYQARNDSVLSNLFCGQLKSEIVCSHCDTKSTAFDPFWDISLPLTRGKSAQTSSYSRYGRSSYSSGPSSVTLADCFELFTKPEKLSGNNQLYCSHCKKHRDVTKTMSLYRVPPVLVIHLKRFSFGSYSRSKLNTAVEFPMDFDISDYSASQRSDHFSLAAVSNHSGSTGGGHYTAFCNVNDPTAHDSAWYCMNDSHCSKVSESRVVSPSAYVLFFVRKSNSSSTSSSL
jgi:ubiquitin C-terminal hydrolase